MNLTDEGSLFWRAARSVVDGDLESLRRLLREEPGLVSMVSPDDFQATLLHFVAANGVRDDYQRSPANAPQVAECLLDAGAEPDAFAGSYGGGSHQTPLCLLVTSWWPHGRGVQVELVRALIQGGAKVDGVEGDAAPLASALLFGYTRAAEALVAEGARANGAFFAAGLGDLVGLQRALEQDTLEGLLGGYVPVLEVPRPCSKGAVIQEAFHFAVTHGRLEVMEWLLRQGASVNGATQGHHCELPAVQALFVGERSVFDWLCQRGADLDLVDRKRGQCARDVLG